MGETLRNRPDVLVMGAGGTLGVAWLEAMVTTLREEAGIDLAGCEYFVGTSAGSVIAASLAAADAQDLPVEVRDIAGEASDALPETEVREPRAPERARRAARKAAGAGATVTAPLVPTALALTRPAGALVRAALMRADRGGGPVPRSLRTYVDSLDVRFDGRLRVATVDRRTGRRVMFGSPKAPRATVAEAVMASCAIPWVFRPIEINGREYVDGGLWSLSNIDAAPAGRGAEVLALLPMAATLGMRSAFGAVRLPALAAAYAEGQALRARGARVRIVAPDEDCARAMGTNLMDGRRRPRVLKAARAQARVLAGLTESV